MRLFGSGPGSPGRPVWLVTFTDLIALLLAFFVMMFATQKVESLKWSAVVESLTRTLNPTDSNLPKHRSATRNLDRKTASRAIDLDYLELIMREKIAADPRLKGILLHKYDDRMVVALSSDLLFPAGGAVPSPKARRVLFALAGILRNIGNRMDVYGHTDPSPVPKSLFRSNWELSIARAAAVARALQGAGYHHELPALGYGESRFPDLRGIESRDRAFELARRVDIVIHPNRWGVQ